MATARPRDEALKAKSARILGARLAVRKPGRTPATTNPTPVASARGSCAVRRELGGGVAALAIVDGAGMEPTLSGYPQRERVRQSDLNLKHRQRGRRWHPASAARRSGS